MALELILRNARMTDSDADSPTVDIGFKDGRIAAIERDLSADCETIDVGGRLVSTGLVEIHIHLDKSRILDRCGPAPDRGTDHMMRVAAVKESFTVEDVYERARQSLEQCITHGRGGCPEAAA